MQQQQERQQQEQQQQQRQQQQQQQQEEQQQQQQQQQQQLTALPPRPAPSRALPLPRQGEEAEEKAASAARAAESGPPPDGARRRWRQDFVFVSTGDAHGEPSRATPTGAMPPPPMPRQLSLPVEALLHRWLGKSTGGRADIV